LMDFACLHFDKQLLGFIASLVVLLKVLSTTCHYCRV
jgi:hypothetical protein